MMSSGLIVRMASGMWLALAPMAVAAQTPSGHLGGGGAIDVSLGRIILSFVICVIIAALAILLIRQRSGKIDIAAFFARIEPSAREIRVIETRRLSPHADICVVRHGAREYLLVLQHGNVQVLRDDPVGAAPGAKPPCG